MHDPDLMLDDFHRNRGSLRDTLESINDWALRAVQSSQAGILLRRARGRIETVASTSPDVAEAHELQVQFDEGPCLDVLKKGGPESLVVADTSNDPRFPTWGPTAAKLDLRSVVSAAFVVGRERLGSLNVYAEHPHAFDLDDLAVVEILARRAGRAVANAQDNEGLVQALDTRKLIGQAQGIVMARLDIDSDRAFAFLMRLSQHQNIKLRDIAAWVVEHRSDRLDGPGAQATS